MELNEAARLSEYQTMEIAMGYSLVLGLDALAKYVQGCLKAKELRDIYLQVGSLAML
jgi:hypothetical protein